LSVILLLCRSVPRFPASLVDVLDPKWAG